MDNKKLVLVVDDAPAILRFVRISLSAAGYNVIMAGGGAEALALVRSEKPDVIVLDMLMSPMSGFDVLRELRQFPDIPVIACSANSAAAERSLSEGATDFITKPFLPDHLAKKIRQVLESRKSRPEAGTH